ncbi:MAG: PAS domain-containing protein [Psychromonas sp.]|nr:PAS domain-containing protein [Alteromonadales bacterium]MCP5078192.1 PAS domain-containing protein [Psychromonas sp.]
MYLSATIIVIFLLVLLSVIVFCAYLYYHFKSSKFDRTHLQALVDSIPDLTWVKDKNSRLLMVNCQFSKEFNLPIKEIIGKDDALLSPSSDASDHQKDDQWVIEKNKILQREEPNTHEDGSTTWAEIILRCLLLVRMARLKVRLEWHAILRLEKKLKLKSII